MFDDEVLEEYIATFYGYGTYNAPYWFVGMEEGGGARVEDTIIRLKGWKDRGERELEDLAERNSTGGGSKFFREHPVAQPTWRQLIRIILSARGSEPTQADVKLYQRDHLGRHKGETCLLELLPLPSPSTSKWAYGSYATLPPLATRDTYRNHYAPFRAKHIASRIAEYQPALVVFYGINWWYRQWWHSVASVEFKPVDTATGIFHIGDNKKTCFIIVKHPASRGISNDYYYQVGKHVARGSLSDNIPGER